jgi:DNA-binding winged helix-turn-helix (wHTH) protein
MNNRVSFGRFVLDFDTRELRRGDRPVALSPKAYELLETLVTNRPKALSKLALQERLWPDTYVIEKNLTNLVADIRKALDDDPAHPRFVRTVHRFGYAFQESPPRVPARAGGGVRFRLFWPDGRTGLSDGEHVLGRDPDLELFFDSPSVSRRHAIIRVEGDEATVEDLGSKNGTFVRDRRLDSSARLRDGDVIRLGSVALTFKVLRARGSTYTEPHKSR